MKFSEKTSFKKEFLVNRAKNASLILNRVGLSKMLKPEAVHIQA
jgi:hypothetical protein